MPNAMTLDPETQELYHEAVQRGLFAHDPEMQQLGHELRARGLVTDPTQGGAVKPSPAPMASPDPGSSVSDPYGDPADQPAAVSAASPVSAVLPPPSALPAPAAAPLAAAPAPPVAAPALTPALPAASPAEPRYEGDPSDPVVKSVSDAIGAYNAKVTAGKATTDDADALHGFISGQFPAMQKAGYFDGNPAGQAWAQRMVAMNWADALPKMPAAPPAPPAPGQMGMSAAPALSPLQSAQQAAATDIESAKEAFGGWWDHVTGSVRQNYDQLHDTLTSPQANNPFGTALHVGALGAGFLDLGKEAVTALPPALKSLYFHAIGHGDDYAVQQIDRKAEEHIGMVAGAPLIAAMPFGLEQATRAMQAYDQGDKAGALKILKAAPGQIGAYARQNKLETALMLLPLLHAPFRAALAKAKAAAEVGAETEGAAGAAREGGEPGANPAAETPAASPSAAPPVETPAAAPEPAPAAAPVPAPRTAGGVPQGRQKPALPNPLAAGQSTAGQSAAAPVHPLLDPALTPGRDIAQAVAPASAAAVPAPEAAAAPPVPAAAAPLEAPASKAADPRLVADLPVDQLHTDPERFQYKIGAGQGGQTGSLTSAPQWNPNFAGVLHVWRDPADGKAYVVNGHNRLALARRVGQKSVDVRFLDASTAAEARTQGALINIAEGQGTAIDAAKLFRDQKITPTELKAAGVNLSGQKAAQGTALANLSPALFGQVVRGEMPVERGALIGDKLPAASDQQTLVAQIDKAQKSGRTLTSGQVSELADAVAAGPKMTETSSTLFGDETTTKSTAIERADVADYIRSQLGSEGRAFSGAAKNADRLAKGNNVIDEATSRKIATQSQQGAELFARLKNAPGPVSDILNAAAQRLAKGENPHAVKADALTKFQAAAPDLFRDAGTDPAGPGPDRPEAAGSLFDGTGSGAPDQEPAQQGAKGVGTAARQNDMTQTLGRAEPDTLAERDAAPEHGDMPPTPAPPSPADLSPEEHGTVTANLAKVASDPEAAPAVAVLQSALRSAKASRLPRIADSAGLFGGKAVSDILENATDRIGAGIAQVTSAARDSSLARATRNGRYRGSYEVDKAAGDAVNQLAASGESANTYAHYATAHILRGLDAPQRALLVDHLLDERAKAIEAAGGTPNRTALRALTPQEEQQVQSDPKIQAALLKFENGPMGTILKLRKFVSPRLSVQQTDSGRFLSLLAKQDAQGNAVNDRAASGRPATGMAGRGTVKGTSHARQATGTAQEYSHDLGEILTHDLTEVNKKANLKQLYKTLLAQRDAQGNRLAYSSALKSGQALPDTITYNGRDYPAVDVKPGYRYVDKSGKIREVSIRVPAPIAADLEDALTPPRPGNDLGAVMQQAGGLTTSLALMTPAELTNHVGRLISLVSKMAPAGESLPRRLAEMAVPYAGPRAGALYRMFSTDMSDPSNVAVLQRIMEANGGSGRPFAQEIGRSLLSKVPGLDKVQHFSHDFLFSLPEGKGLSGFDLRLRVMAEKMRAAAEGNTDPQRVREFASQFGQYTSKPEKIVQSIRTIAPFAATSLPVKLSELRVMLGDAGYKNLTPAQQATLRAETLFRGTAGTVLGFSLMNHLLSGHWPWQNAPGHETDLEAGKDKDGKPVYIAGNRFDPTLERPLSTLGAPDAMADVRRLLHDPQAGKASAGAQIRELLAHDAARGAYNSAGAALSSPLSQFVTTATVGHDPLYLTRGGTLLPTAETARKGSGQSQAVNNLRAAIGGLNPALGAALHTDKQSRETPYEAPLWRTVQQLERVTGPILKQDAPQKGGKKVAGPALRELRRRLRY